MKKVIALLTGMFLILTLTAAGCPADAQETVDEAIRQSQDIDSQRVDFDVDMAVRGDLSSLGSEFADMEEIRLVIRGGADVDMTDADSPKARGNVSIEGIDELLSRLGAGEEDSETQITRGLVSGFLSDIEFVNVDNRFYLRLAGTWYDTGEGLDLSEDNAQCYQDAMKDSSRWGSEHLFVDLQDAGSDEIDGVDTDRFTADVDVDGALTAYADIARSCDDADVAGRIEGGKSELVSFFRSFNTEMWIDGDGNFRQIRLQMDIDPDIVSGAGDVLGDLGATTVPTTELESITVDATLKFSRIGETIDITMPEGEIMPIEDLLNTFFGLGAFGGLGGVGGLGGLEGMQGLEGLPGLEGIEGLEGFDLEGLQGL
ncbi:MAG: hypothetical protein IBX61_00375 [Thermoleophilia bacterium]|nr:hypothetical protein [Thermoleophilia bacterium]